LSPSGNPETDKAFAVGRGRSLAPCGRGQGEGSPFLRMQLPFSNLPLSFVVAVVVIARGSLSPRGNPETDMSLSHKVRLRAKPTIPLTVPPSGSHPLPQGAREQTATTNWKTALMDSALPLRSTQNDSPPSERLQVKDKVHARNTLSPCLPLPQGVREQTATTKRKTALMDSALPFRFRFTTRRMTVRQFPF
jgi:hypothetical protein